MENYKESDIAMEVIKEICSLKHFYLSILNNVIDIKLKRHSFVLSEDQRKSLQDRVVSALGNLGYQTHLDIPQTITINRDL